MKCFVPCLQNQWLMKLYHVLHVLLWMLVNDFQSIGLFIVDITERYLTVQIWICALGTVHSMTGLTEGQMRGDLTLKNTTHNQYKVKTESTFDNPSYIPLSLCFFHPSQSSQATNSWPTETRSHLNHYAVWLKVFRCLKEAKPIYFSLCLAHYWSCQWLWLQMDCLHTGFRVDGATVILANMDFSSKKYFLYVPCLI